MPSAPDAHRRSPLRLLAVVATVAAAALAPTALAPGMAAADAPAGATVVGQLVQAWPEHEHEAVTAHAEAAEPLSWIEPAAGDAVRVPTDDVEGIPAGSTVSVTVGSPVRDEATSESGVVPARDVLAADVVAAPAAASHAPAAAPLTNQVTVVMVRAGGVAADGATLGQVVAAVDGPVADFWSEQSGGAIRVGVTASHDWITTVAGCSDAARLWDEAAARVGFVPGDGKHLLLYVSTNAPGCSYALGEVGKEAATGGRLYVTSTGASVIAHEIGHNFGLGHSSGRQCDGAVETGSCRTTAYRDLYDVMGVSWAHMGSLNAAQAARLGVLPAAQQVAVAAGSSPTTVTLAPLSAGAGSRALRLTDADGVDYWLEYRPAAGRDAWVGGSADDYRLQAGVLLRRAEGLPDTAVLLDGTPTAAGGWDDDLQAALPLGAAVPVSGGDFSVVVQSVSAEGAVLTVTPSATPAVGVPAPSRAGSVPGGVMAAQAGGTVPPAGIEPGTTALAAPDLQGALRAPREQSLESAADATAGSGLLVPVAGALLAASLLLVVGLARRARLRVR